MEGKTKEMIDETVKALGGDLEKKVVLNKTMETEKMEDFVFRRVDKDTPDDFMENDDTDYTDYDWEAHGFTLDDDDGDDDDPDTSLDPVEVLMWRFPFPEEKKDEEEADDVAYPPSRPASPMSEEDYHSS